MFLDPNGLEVLAPDACRELVDRNEIGRLAFDEHGRVTVLPVTYAVIDDRAVIRTTTGSKVSAAVSGAQVALEVDDIDPRRHVGWSVLARGVMELVVDEDEISALDAAGLHSWGQTGNHFLRLRLDDLTGRRMHNGTRRPAR